MQLSLDQCGVALVRSPVVKRSDELAPPRRKRLHVDVAQLLLDGMNDGRWPVGSRLPSDRELAEELHVSRPTVREAILGLEFAGLVDVRHGAGVYVLGAMSNGPPGTKVSESPAQLVEARIRLEPMVAALCATRLSEADIDDLASLIAASEKCVDDGDPGELVRLGLEFHRQLASGCGNEYLAGFSGALVSVTDHPLWHLLHRQVLSADKSRRSELIEHRYILDAIRRRDPEEAQLAMKLHLEGLWSIILDDAAPQPRSAPPPADQGTASDPASALMRQAFRRYASGVMLLTYADDEGQAFGMTATSVCSVSADPPTILACVNRAAKTHDEIVRNKRFAISLLSHAQRGISEFCARPGAPKGLPGEWVADVDGKVPVIRDALGSVQCRLTQTVNAGSHTVLIGSVIDVELGPEGNPLLYFGGAYRSIRDVGEDSSWSDRAGIIW
jgi:DNA-binding FadR family transcriptional regulator/flavin reductase (DIM6/NTAB) family NADH-FMN oxidoreductase RutF